MVVHRKHNEESSTLDRVVRSFMLPVINSDPYKRPSSALQNGLQAGKFMKMQKYFLFVDTSLLRPDSMYPRSRTQIVKVMKVGQDI